MAGTAEFAVEAALERINRDNGRINAFTRVFADQALSDARAIDARVATGDPVGPLVGVPFAVKDLFDIEGLATTAGAKMRLDGAPARRDAEAVRRMKAAGAILVGTTNMDEYAYGFATVNDHFGVTHNPHDLDRLAGGSSGGSAAAVAADMVPLSLGSDTNGSIRVPASLCGVWGMRPAMDAVPLDGVFPFVDLLDTAGPFARSCADLKRAYEVLSGTVVGKGGPPRVARLTGFFERGASSEAIAAVDAVMSAVGGDVRLDLSDAEAARSAAFLITASHGAALHLDVLKTRAMEYDPAVRDRLLAGAVLPSAVVVKALEFAKRWRRKILAAFEDYDVLLAPATPVTAPRIDDGTILMDGKPVSARANLGIYAQAIGLALPVVVSAPILKSELPSSSEAIGQTKSLPMGVQFIAAPGHESLLFDLLQSLEDKGILGVSA